MIDLSTNYMGLKLRSPLVVSACTLSEDPEDILKMAEAGAGAVVLFSLFEEQIKLENNAYEKVIGTTSDNFPEAQNFFPDLSDYHVGSERYLEIIHDATKQVDIPIIASLNGITNEGWIQYAAEMQKAGASGIELNIYYIPADLSSTGRDIEQRYLDILRQIKRTVDIPVAVKMNPYFSALGHMVLQLEHAGANGLVLFNRFYQPDMDIDNLVALSNLKLSSSNEIRLPLLWTAILFGQLNISIAASTGVQGPREVIKYLLAGADVVMTASALYKHGISYLHTINEGIKNWMAGFNFIRISDFQGLLSQQNIKDPSAYERANYIKILEQFKR